MWSWRLGCHRPEGTVGDQLHIIGRVTLGHERPMTTHGYVEADLKMKEESLRRLEELPAARRPRRAPESRLLSFLEAKDYVNYRPRPTESTFPANHTPS